MAVDTDLIRRAQTGDSMAFNELVQRHDRIVFALAARYVSSADEAKDIFQEVMIRVFRGLPAFRFESEFSTWLHRITVNVCLSHRRSVRNGSLTPLSTSDDGDSEEDRDLPSTTPSPADAAIDADIAGHIQEALQSLSPRQRMVFTLRHYEGHSLREIANVLHCTEGTVKRYLFTATRRMRDHLHQLL